MAWLPILTDLNYLLARAFRDETAAIKLAEEAGIDTLYISTTGPPVLMWYKILDYTYNTAGNLDLIVALLQKATAPTGPARDNQTLKGVLQNLLDNKAPVEAPVAAAWKPQPADEAETKEKLMGAISTLLPISFLEHGLICAKSVGRIVVGNGLGTGFLVANNYLITNNHVIPTVEVARTARVQFNYQKNLQGLDSPFEEFGLAPDAGPDAFRTDAAFTRDYTIVKLQGDANARYGNLEFSDVAAKKNDFVNIIQHPSGGPKQIALYHNVVAFADQDRVQYLTDTLPGSSGAPVFGADWRVVALHHAGGSLREPGSDESVIRNEGINGLRIREILAQLPA